MIPVLPYLQTAVAGYHTEFGFGFIHRHYVQWLHDQGVITPIGKGQQLDHAMIEFTEPKYETMFILRWS
jgi:hypothetical protein